MGVYSYGLKGLKAGATKLVQKFLKPQKTTGTEVISSVNVGKNLAKKRKFQDDVSRDRSRIYSDYMVSDKNKVELRKKSNQPKLNKKIADIYDKKAKGGRVGLKRGTPKRQTNIQKIKKTFGAKNKLGMQSVIYGLDKNPNVTKADPKAKFIAAANKKKKKKVI
jgi:hypothetical protein